MLAVAVVAVGGLGVPRLLASPADLEMHVVKDGETLWGLAKAHSSAGDPRSYVYELRELNHLMSAQVFPGQKLILPASQ